MFLELLKVLKLDLERFASFFRFKSKLFIFLTVQGAWTVVWNNCYIGENSKIGALALVNKSFSDNSAIVENPAINKV